MASGSGSGGEERWYFTQEQIQNSPSRKTGIDGDSEINNRQLTAYLIQEMGQRLQVSQLCINTAIVYMHRFYAFHSFSEFHQNGIATASLFLAAKVEEQPRKLEHVIKAAAMCLKQEVPDPSKDNYQEMAQDLVFNENVLLQTLGFDVAIDHPHTHVVKTCHLVCACKDLAQTSYFLASNSLHLTTMCLQYKPTVVACFCIYLACKWSRWEIPQSTEGKYWFYYVDKTVTAELLEQLTDDFLSIYEKSPGRLKIKLNSIMALAQSVKHENPPPARPLKEPIVVSGTSSSSRSQQPNRITPASSSSSSSSHHRSQHPASYTPNTTYHHTNKKHVPSEHPSKGSSQQLPSSNAPMQKPTHPAIPTTATSSSTSSSQQRQPRFDRLTNVKHSTPPPTSSSLIPPSATTNNNSQLQSSSTSASSSASRNSTGGTSSNHNAPFAGRPGVSGHNDVINNNHLSGTTANARDAAARNRMSATNPHQQQLSQERYQAKAEAQQQRHLLGGKDNKLSGSDSNNMLKKQVNSFSASNNNSNSKNSIEMQRNSGNSNMSGGSIPASSSAGMGQSMNSQNPRHTSYSQPPNYNQAMANKQQQQYSQQQIGEQPNNNSSSSSMSVQKSSSADLFRLTDDLVSRPMEQCSPAQQSRPSGGISNSNNNSSSLNKAPSIFSPESEWNDPLPPPVEKLSSKMMVNNHALPPSSNNGLAVLSNKPIKDSPKKHERRSETPTKHKQHRLDQHPTTPTSQSSKMKTDMRSSSTSLSGGGVKKEVVDGFPSVYKRPFDQDNTMSMNTVVKQERDEYMRESKVRKVDIDRVPSPKNMAAVPPQNLLVDTKPSKMMSSTTLNGIETNPDLVSSLLKESLFNDSKLSLRTGGYVGSIKKELDYMEEEDVKPLAVEPDDDSLHRSKSEKKKKKEKHKHKEKDKSKEERKKHKKDKERHKDRPTEGGMPDVHNPIKITIPKDKLNMTAHDGSSMNADRSQTHHGAGMISAPNVTGGFKIKIPKDRIKQHEFHHGNGGGNNEDSNMAGQPPLPPPSSSSSGNSQTSLKIKISKDVIENFNRDGGGSSGHHHHHSSASGGHHVGDVYAGHGHSSKKKDRDRDRSRDREREKAAKKLEHSKMNGANVQVVNNYHGGGNGSIGQNAMPPRANTTAPGPNKMMQMSSNTSQYMSQSNPMMKVGQQHPAPPPYNVHQQPPSHNISGESGGNSNHGRMSSGDQQQYNNYYYSNKK